MADIQKVVEGQIKGDETGVAIPILQRNGKPYLANDGSTATITVLGSESKAYRTMRDAIWRKNAEAQTEADTAESRIAIAIGAITDWHGWESNGAPVPFTADHAKPLLTLEHILLQVEGGIGRRSSFFADALTG